LQEPAFRSGFSSDAPSLAHWCRVGEGKFSGQSLRTDQHSRHDVFNSSYFFKWTYPCHKQRVHNEHIFFDCTNTYVWLCPESEKMTLGPEHEISPLMAWRRRFLCLRAKFHWSRFMAGWYSYSHSPEQL
jgi:hypothetical protein